jgi:hypothetical protein
VEEERVELTDLKNAHALEDVWVVASDASLDYFPAGFFEGRTVITINTPHVPSRYCVSKNDQPLDGSNGSWIPAQMEGNPDTLYVVSKHRNGELNRPASDLSGAVLFEHWQNRVHLFNPATDIPDTPGMLLVSYSTLGSALHLAAFMGARTCFVVGASGGAFGDKAYVADYSAGSGTDIVSATSRQTQGICDALTVRYGTQFVTVLPWANMRLGGVKFEAEYGRLN